jgi:pyrroloquinoline quinone biosynthesis protein B
VLGPYLLVLGVAQDAGHPQAGCVRDCCAAAWLDASRRHLPTSLALVDPASGRRWLFEATPALPEQLHRLDGVAPSRGPVLDGVFLTHAHMGHYTGLVHLGREGLGASGLPVWAMPRMAEVIRGGAPWSLLVTAGNADLRGLVAGVPVSLGAGLTVTPVAVAHRDEFSETVGFRIDGPERSVFFLPDIDRWQGFDLRGVVESVDVALLDGTFFADGELAGRDMSAIPHPRVRETMDLLSGLPADRRARVRFIHLNHTNPLLDSGSAASTEVAARGFGVAMEGERLAL